eukprot:g12548.t1
MHLMSLSVDSMEARVEAIFNAAVEKSTPTEREAYLDGACGNDAGLRVRVDALLSAHDEAGNFLITPTVEQPNEGPGSRIGNYKILQQIGEGGFGVVYMAEQEEPIRRKVALKIIKLGMDTKQVIARFEAERQALAMMEHPNIAKVFDAGATQSGRPYFVMELVKGIPITEYCDQNHLKTEERLQLFVDVCGAIQHAHRKGIIHRDLKPQNVMVTLHDGRPVPKVIDFGISKATNQRLTERTLFTEYHQFIGTPQYMSPEQAEMSGLDIDTRSDVYSLGALLYELLTGTPPFEAKTLQHAGYAEIQRIIREVAPPKPSTRLATLVEQGTDSSRQSGGEPRTLSRLIAGDLDWIVMKAMEKDRTRRYESALELANDIQRHLRNEPVVAGAPSVSYQARKFVQRHRYGVIVSSAILVILLLGCVFTTIGFLQASHERDLAHEARARADEQADRSKAIADFLQDMLVATDPERATRLDIDVQQVLATARDVFGNDHATVAATLSSLAAQLQSVGNYEGAEPLLRESIRIWKKHYGANHINVGMARSQLGALLRIKGDESNAKRELERSVEILKSQGKGDSLAVSDTLLYLADVLQNRGDYAGAEKVLRESLRIRRAAAPHQSLQIAITLNLLANVLVFSGNKKTLEPVLLECIAAFRKALPAESNVIAKVSLGAGEYYLGADQLDKAEEYLRESLRIYGKTETTSIMYRDIALQYLSTVVERRSIGSDNAVAVRKQFLAYVRKQFQPGETQLAGYLAGHADFLVSRDRFLEAIPIAIEALAFPKTATIEKQSPHAKAVKALNRAIGRIALVPNRPVAEYNQALDGVKAILAENPDNLNGRLGLAMLHFRLGDHKSAFKNLYHDNALIAKPADFTFPACLATAAMVHHHLGETSKAGKLLERLRATMKQKKYASDEHFRALHAETEGVHVMIARALSLLILATVVLGGAVAGAEEPIKLRYRMQKGEKLIYQSASNTVQTESAMGRKATTKINVNAFSVRTFKSVDKKGNIQFETETKRIAMSADNDQVGKYTYDSRSTDNEKSSTFGSMFTEVSNTLIGATFNVTVTPLGEVKPVKGFEELLAEVVKNNPMKDKYTNKGFRVEISDSFPKFPEKAVKKGDTWKRTFSEKVPGVGTVKMTEKYTHAGTKKVGKRETVKIDVTYDGTIELDIKRGGFDITGTLTVSDASGTVYFDPKQGCVVSKKKSVKLSGTMNIDVNGMNVGVENSTTTTTSMKLLDKLPQ